MHAAQLLRQLIVEEAPPDVPAFLGYGPGRKGGFAIRVCSWCPGSATVHAWANREGMDCTDTICPACNKKLLKDAGIDD